MRWNSAKQLKEGSTRNKTYFTIIPVCIGGEYRWLEKVTVKQRLEKREGQAMEVYDCPEPYLAWVNIEFT